MSETILWTQHQHTFICHVWQWFQPFIHFLRRNIRVWYVSQYSLHEWRRHQIRTRTFFCMWVFFLSFGCQDFNIFIFIGEWGRNATIWYYIEENQNICGNDFFHVTANCQVIWMQTFLFRFFTKFLSPSARRNKIKVNDEFKTISPYLLSIIFELVFAMKSTVLDVEHESVRFDFDYVRFQFCKEMC